MIPRRRPPTRTARAGRQALAAWIAALLTVGGIAVVAEEDGSTSDVRTDDGSSRPEPVPIQSIPPLTLPEITVPGISVPGLEVPGITLVPGGTLPSLPPVTLPPPITELIEEIEGPSDEPAMIDRTGFWLVDADRNRARLVVGDLTVDAISFAPDGHRAVITTYDHPFRNGGLPVTMWVVDLATGVRRPILEPRSGVYGPSWSPDGEWIAYHRVGRSTDADDPTAPPGPHLVSEIWLVRPDGTDAHLLSVIDGYGGHFDWSPDGSRLVANLVNDDRVLVADIRNGTEVRWPYVDASSSDWSPDGTQLVLSTNYDGPTALMDPDTGASHVLSATSTEALWSPSGEWIAVRDPDSYTALLGVDGSPGPRYGYGGPVGWSSDGRSLAFEAFDISVADVVTGEVRVAARSVEPVSLSFTTSWVPGSRWIGVVGNVFPE